MTVDEKGLEAAARAMSDGNWEARSFCETPSGEEPEEFREYWRGKARLAITAYEAAKTAEGAVDGWQDISTAPFNKWILTAKAGENGVNLCCQTEGNEWHDQSGLSTVTHHSMAAPTHWQPLPAPLPPQVTHE